MNVIDILEELEGTGSRLAKEEILGSNHKNCLLKRVFTASCDPYTVYYINKIKVPTNDCVLNTCLSDDDINRELNDFIDFITEKLATRELTGNAAKHEVENELANLSTITLQKWCKRILAKNLRCGVQVTTINKTWPGLIKEFSVQLAKTLQAGHDKDLGRIVLRDKVSYPVRVEPKLDGLRCVAIKHNGIVTLHTRNGNTIDTLPKIKRELEESNIDDIVFDGELLASNWNDSTSIVMSHKRHKDDDSIKYHVFDAMLFEHWANQRVPSDWTLEFRVNFMNAIIEDHMKNTNRIVCVPGIKVYDEQSLLSYYSKCMDEQYEGIMVKNLTALYDFKRSAAIQKLKPITTFEGVIVGHHEGRKGTKFEGQFGGFSVLLPNGIITNVGSGFNDALRAEIQLLGFESYIGKIVECEAQPDPETDDGLTVAGKMRFPVFIRFRDESDVDKTIMKVYEELCKK